MYIDQQNYIFWELLESTKHREELTSRVGEENKPQCRLIVRPAFCLGARTRETSSHGERTQQRGAEIKKHLEWGGQEVQEVHDS